MMEIIGKYSVILLISIFLTGLEKFIDSDYLKVFLINNAIILAVAVFTIHTASVGILLSQLEIISHRTGKTFKSTLTGIRHSFVEFFVLIILMTVSLIILSTCIDKTDYCNFNNFISSLPYIKEVLIISILFSIISMISIIYDTTNAIIITLEFSSNQ